MTMAKLSQEQVDELLYCSRAGELDDFREATIRLVSSRTGQEIDLSAEPTPQDCETVSGLLNEIQDANEARNSPLHYAAANGHTDIVDFLLSRCTLSALLAQNESGNTALHWAAFNGHMTVVQALVDRIESLIQPLTSSNGSRAADKETRKEAELTVEELDAQAEREAQRRSVWDVVNKAGRGPMSEAQMNNKENVVDFLLQRMVTAPAGKADEDVGEADSTKPAEAVVRAEQNGTQEAVKLAERTKQLDLHGTDKS